MNFGPEVARVWPEPNGAVDKAMRGRKLGTDIVPQKRHIHKDNGAAAEKTAAREEIHAHLPVRSAADAHLKDHGDARGRGESGPPCVASGACASVRPRTPTFPPFAFQKNTT